MKATFGRICLILGLLCLSLAAAVSIGLDARHDGVTILAHTAGMHLQDSADGDEIAAAPDDEGARTAACEQRDCPAPKQEFALAQEFAPGRIEAAPQPHESKAFTALGDDVQLKSKD
jgi:hypothetical protein